MSVGSRMYVYVHQMGSVQQPGRIYTNPRVEGVNTPTTKPCHERPVYISKPLSSTSLPHSSHIHKFAQKLSFYDAESRVAKLCVTVPGIRLE